MDKEGGYQTEPPTFRGQKKKKKKKKVKEEEEVDAIEIEIGADSTTRRGYRKNYYHWRH